VLCWPHPHHVEMLRAGRRLFNLGILPLPRPHLGLVSPGVMPWGAQRFEAGQSVMVRPLDVRSVRDQDTAMLRRRMLWLGQPWGKPPRERQRESPARASCAMAPLRITTQPSILQASIAGFLPSRHGSSEPTSMMMVSSLQQLLWSSNGDDHTDR